MPFLDNIISSLNTHWLSYLPEGSRLFGITETIVESDNGAVKIYPGIVSNDGEVEMVEPDDSFPITIYHKLDSIINGIDDKTAVIKGIEVANMSLMCSAFRDKVFKPANWIESLIKDVTPLQSKFGINQVSNFRFGTSTFDKLALLNREYVGVELRYPHLMFFEMKYRIESNYRKGCFIDNN